MVQEISLMIPLFDASCLSKSPSHHLLEFSSPLLLILFLKLSETVKSQLVHLFFSHHFLISTPPLLYK